MKKILVCCGSSMITSTLALNKIKTYMEKEKIEVQFIQCKFAEVPARVSSDHPDVIVPTGMLDESAAGGIPIVKGTCFITGIGVEQALERIKDVLGKERKTDNG